MAERLLVVVKRLFREDKRKLRPLSVLVQRLMEKLEMTNSEALATIERLAEGSHIELHPHIDQTFVSEGANFDTVVLRSIGIEVPPGAGSSGSRKAISKTTKRKKKPGSKTLRRTN
jgi:hypothetical protein